MSFCKQASLQRTPARQKFTPGTHLFNQCACPQEATASWWRSTKLTSTLNRPNLPLGVSLRCRPGQTIVRSSVAP